MTTLNIDFLTRCIGTLELALEQLQQHEPGEFIISYPTPRSWRE